MSVSETLQHAKTRFEMLADEFEKSGDTASWAMCSTDAEMMGRAIAALSDQPKDSYPDDLIFANEQNIKAARKYKARLEYMEAKYGKIDWDAAPPPSSAAGEVG